jgi:hypothetical protein
MTEKENPSQGSRYMTEKESVKAIRHRDQLFQPTMTCQAISRMAVRVTVQATDAFKHYKLRQAAGVLLKGSCKSHTIQDLRCDVVMLRRSLCCFS